MSLIQVLLHKVFTVAVHTVLRPLRDQAFESTRRAKISPTEQEALSSGSVGFEQELLGGRPRWDRLLDMPEPALTTEEQAFLNTQVEQLCAMLDDWKIRTEWHDLPESVWQFMKEQGFFGMIIPQQYGGLGFSARAHSDVVQKLASRSTTACVTAMVPNSLGPAELLIRYGTDAQKTYYLPRLASGEEIPSFALTEPTAGSDASGMVSTGVVCRRDGQLGILLNWEKRYITLAPVTTLLGVAFKLHDPDGLLGDSGKTDWGITLALVPVNTPGVETGRRHNPLGIPFQNGPTRGRDVWVPMDAIIGGPEYAGQGWRMLMECLSVGRCISLPALSTGAAKLMCRLTGAYSRIRRQFRVSLDQFEGVEELLARMAGQTYVMEAARVTTLQMLDQGEHPTILSAVLKYHLTEQARTIINDGMDILGGKAICDGPSNLVSALYRGIPIGITVEGANILTRNMIIFGQGSVRSHPYLLKEIEAARLPDKNEARRQFSDWMAWHVQHSATNTLASLWLGLTDGWGSRVPKDAQPFERRYFQHMNRLSAAYATLADVMLMVLGDSVKRRERISALLGDVMSHLYLASCVLRHYQAQGRKVEDVALVRWACQTHLAQVEDSLDRLLQNFPIAGLGSWMRMVILPRGRRMHPPTHRMDRAVAAALLKPGAQRDRLTHGIYLPESRQESLAQLEHCFKLVVTAETLDERMRQARKQGVLTEKQPDALVQEALVKHVLTADEAEHLAQTERWRHVVIQVDDFDAALLEPALSVLPEEKKAWASHQTLESRYPAGIHWDAMIPDDMTLVDLIEQAVQTYADQPCIDFLGKKYAYRDLDRLINQAAAGLQAIGVKPGVQVGLYMPNTPYYPVLFFAALKAGATVVNFCTMHTVAELRQQAEDSATRIVVTLDLTEFYDKAETLRQEGVLDRVVVCRMEAVLPFVKAKAFRFLKRHQWTDLRTQTNGNGLASPVLPFEDLVSTRIPFTPVAIAPSDLAVLQYTGGTTGTPKGAMLTHANLVANVFQIEAYFTASPDKPVVQALLRPGHERVLASIPYFHIFGMTVAMVMGLKLGGELLILPNPRDMKQTVKTLREKRPTLFPTVPRLLQALAECPGITAQDLSSLETVISGGAALPPGVVAEFERLAGKPGLIRQGYGLTETAPVAACNPPFGANKSDSVGLPLPGTQIRITDPEHPDRVLPLGEVGEICIAGPQVMAGYFQRDQETSESLHQGWFRTGDLGYLDADYYVHIVDRKKRMILVNGFNVYPTQIEAVLSTHPAVAECLVIGVPDGRSGEAAKVFVRLRTGAPNPPAPEDLRDFMAMTLSRIEVPKYVSLVRDELPKTPVGKPDWRAMQERERLSMLGYGDPSADWETASMPMNASTREQAS